jgi:thymidine kinase
MAQLYFRHSTMNAGKSMDILKIANNYEEQRKRVLLAISAIDTRHGVGKITSRVGLSRQAHVIYEDTNLIQLIEANLPLHCVLIDEGQFLHRHHVLQLTKVVDHLNVPVIVYGLKNDFQNNLFEGSIALLTYADKIEEVKTVCWFCNRKALMNLRVAGGRPIYEGEQIQIGGNESYVPVCRKHYFDKNLVETNFEFFNQLETDGLFAASAEALQQDASEEKPTETLV